MPASSSPAYCPTYAGEPCVLGLLDVFARPERNVRITSAATRLARDGDPRDEDLQELHRRRVGGRRLRRHVREHESRERRDDRRLSEVRAGRCRPRGRSREGGLRRVAARPGAEARRDSVPLRPPDDRAQGRARGPDEPRDGEGAGRGGRGRPGSDRHELLHGRRRAPALRADHAVRAAGQVQHERADADRRRRRDHAVELPDRDPVLEDRAGARRREHGCVQARHRHARAGRALRRAARGVGRPRGRRQHRPRRGRRGREAARRASRMSR